ncbi:MAG: 2-dehydropantoate 2-reductase [Anaerolineales bacterium]
MNEKPLSLLVFGAGAIGTYIGGSLALDGHRVVFLERPQVAESLRAGGMHLTLPAGRRAVQPLHVAASLEAALQAGPFDAALFALKSFDTPAFVEQIRPYAADLPPVVCLSNGVENEQALAAALGAGKVIPATVTTAIGRTQAGDVRVERLRGLGIAAGHPLAERLTAACTQAGLQARLYPHAAGMKWSKMLTNLLANATSAILDMTPGEIFAHPGLCALEVRQLREALAVMRAQRIPVTDLPGTPVRLLALGVRLPVALSRPLLRRAVGKGRGNKMPSFHIDLHSGRGKSEVGYLNGAVVRFGAQYGIPTPVNRLLTETLTALSEGRLPLDAYAHDAGRLLADLG